MKKTIIRIISLLLTLVLTAGSLPVSAWAQEPLSWTAGEKTLELSEIITSGAAVSTHSGNGLPLAEGNHERWIDRLADIPPYAMDLYHWMEENSDGDGTEDALIQVEEANYLSGNYMYQVVSFSESVPFSVAADADDDTIIAAGAQAANAVIDENIARVGAWVSAVVQAFDRDHGEIFWLSGSNRIFMPSSQIRFEFNGTDWKAVFEQKICMTLKSRSFDVREEEYREEAVLWDAITERDRAINRILTTVTGTTRQEQIRQINEWLTKHNCYNTSYGLSDLGADARNCLGALDGRVGEQGPVCEGYARAFQVLCKALEIPCVLVDGEANNGSRTEGHMWNYVQMENGKWYAVDVTWNDPGVAGVTEAVSGYEREDFLLCGGNTVVGGMTFLQSHPVSNTVADGGTAFINGPVLEREAYVYEPVVHEHSYTETVTPPTCTEQGYTTYTCPCGDSFVDSYMDATGHSFGDWEVTTQATCTAEGEERRQCENYDHYESREIEKTAHNYESVVTPPTEEERGYTTHACTACGHSYVDSYTDPLGHTHSYEAEVTAPTCTEQGYTTHTCPCGDSYVDSYVEATGHSFGDWEVTTQATCTAEGEEQRECASCGHTESRAIDKTAHDYESVVTSPTEEERGYTTHTCTACGHSYVDSYTDPLGHTHSYEAEVTAPTCTEQGYTTHTCACGDTYVDSYVDATGHDFGNWEVKTEATCTAEGEEQRECASCGHTESREIEKTAHNYESVVTPPTEEERGYTTHTCTACGYSYVDSYTDPLGHTHSYESEITAPTCTEQGYTTHTCPCGDSFVDSYVEAIGHDFGSWQKVDDLVHQRNCAVCGHSETDFHAWEQENVGENGILETRTCTLCRYTLREVAPVVGVWETDIVFPAADLGVQAPDIVFRCKLTFGEDGIVTADWESVELTAIRMYFHTMFVNSYYACAYGAGITSFEEVERYCLESTGMGVAEYMDAFLNSFDMNALFRPESTEDSYRLNAEGDAMYTDLQIMAIASDPEVANRFAVSGDTLEWTADSYDMPEYTFVCARVGE